MIPVRESLSVESPATTQQRATEGFPRAIRLHRPHFAIDAGFVFFIIFAVKY
jgi:hypothetical protein